MRKRFCGAKHWRSVNAPQKVKLSEGSRADCVAIERTSEAKCPQGAARSHFDNLGVREWCAVNYAARILA